MKQAKWILCLCLAAPACDDEPDIAEKIAEGERPRQVMRIDKQAKTGRMFMYLDEQGNVVKTADYGQIPERFRSAVVVVDGRKRSRVKRSQSGELKITALPPKITASEREGAAAAEDLLEKHPPTQGPPSTEAWSEEQWREEIRRELLELKREEEKD